MFLGECIAVVGCCFFDRVDVESGPEVDLGSCYLERVDYVWGSS
jgi:hypothetical protein